MQVVVRKRLDQKGIWTYFLDISDNGTRCQKYLPLHYSGDRRNKAMDLQAEEERQKYLKRHTGWCPVSLRNYMESELFVSLTTPTTIKKIKKVFDEFGDIYFPTLTKSKLRSYFNRMKKNSSSKQFEYYKNCILDAIEIAFQQGYIAEDVTTLFHKKPQKILNLVVG